MGDPRRFDEFAKWCAARYPLDVRIADVAGGKGYLRAALRDHGFCGDIDTWDPVRRLSTVRTGKKGQGRDRHFVRLFNVEDAKPYGLVLGMHPDEATDVICSCVAQRFACVPCCVKPTLAAYFGNGCSQTQWVHHLRKLSEKSGFHVESGQLAFQNRNVILWGER